MSRDSMMDEDNVDDSPAPSDNLKSYFLEKTPDDDFGLIRQRWNKEAFEMNYILPAPRHDFTFTDRSGWRYHPCAKFLDRLGESPSGPVIAPADETMTDIDYKRKETDTPANESELKIRRLNISDNKATASSGPTTSALKSTSGSSESQTKSSDATIVSHSTDGSSSKKSQESNMLSPAQALPDQSKPTNPRSAPMNVPMATGEVPKSTLYALYGKKPRRIQIGAADYITWDNGAKTHELKFTSVFVCPKTKEIFQAGKYGDSYDEYGGLTWFNKKAIAEHAAASRALDCWNLREKLSLGRYGLDEPYLKGNHPTLPMEQIPLHIQEKITEARGDVNVFVGDREKTTGPAGSAPKDGPGITSLSQTAQMQDNSRRSQQAPPQPHMTPPLQPQPRLHSQKPPPPPPRRVPDKNDQYRGSNRAHDSRDHYGPQHHNYPDQPGLPPQNWSRDRHFDDERGYAVPDRRHSHQRHLNRSDGRGYDDSYRAGERFPRENEQSHYNQQFPYDSSQYPAERWDRSRGAPYNDQRGREPPYGTSGNNYYGRGNYGGEVDEYSERRGTDAGYGIQGGRGAAMYGGDDRREQMYGRGHQMPHDRAGGGDWEKQESTRYDDADSAEMDGDVQMEQVGTAASGHSSGQNPSGGPSDAE